MLDVNASKYKANEMTLFQEVNDLQVRAWNQRAIILNLDEDKRNPITYMERLPKGDLNRLHELAARIDKHGVEYVHAEINRNHVPQGYLEQ